MIQQLLAGVTVLEVVLSLGGITLIVYIVMKVAKPLKRFSDFVDDVAGEKARPGVPARPGLMERVCSLESKLDTFGTTRDTIQHEVFPNSGQSLRDAVDNAGERLERIEVKVDRDYQKITALQDEVTDVKVDVDEVKTTQSEHTTTLDEHTELLNDIKEQEQ